MGKTEISPDLAQFIDHTLLKPEATDNDITRICREAREYRFAAVCVNPGFVPLASSLLAGSPVAVCAVCGFPLGATLASAKAFEAAELARLGASEIDMVINIGALKSGRVRDVEDDIRAVVDASGEGVLVKVIIECALLTQKEKIAACECALRAGAGFVKTSTGFASGGATADDVALMRRTVGDGMGVKASGGIKDRAAALSMIRAGATRIGTSSGIAIACGADIDRNGR